MNTNTYYARYEPELDGANIRGIYTEKTRYNIKGSYVKITAVQHKMFIGFPNCYGIRMGKFEQIKELPNTTRLEAINNERKNAKAKITSDFTVGSYTYVWSSELLTNLTLNLAIAALDPEHSTNIWCRANDGDKEWMFLEHSLDELVSIAKAFDKRRRTNSQNLHERLN